MNAVEIRITRRRQPYPAHPFTNTLAQDPHMMDGDDGDFEMDSAFDDQRQGPPPLPGFVPLRGASRTLPTATD